MTEASRQGQAEGRPMKVPEHGISNWSGNEARVG